jgi:hypothetical protein
MIGLWGVGAGVLMLVFSPILRKWAHGANDVLVQTLEPPVDGERQTVEPQAARADRGA